MDLRIEGKAALVTGGGQGIGKMEALFLAREGVRVAVNDILPDNAGMTAEEIQEIGGHSVAIPADVRSEKEAAAMIREVIRVFGTLDILVNNAGVGGKYLGIPASAMEEETWDTMLEVHLKGTFLCSRFAAQEMISRKSGRIINTTSAVGQMGGWLGQTNYAAAKAGVIGFTKTLAKELAPYGITVNAVSPGLVQTEMLDRLGPEALSRIVEQIPMARLAKPEEVASLVAFLASSHASYITGSVFEINGGRTEYAWPAGIKRT